MVVDLDALDREVLRYCEDNSIMGMLRVTCRDRIRYSRSIGWADAEAKIPFTERSMFSFYSLSKPFCAMGLLLLKDQGLVELDAHPGSYVPEAAGFDARVTVRHLLHHISGLPDGEQLPEFRTKYAPGYPEKAREHVLALSKYPSFFAPGTEHMYANINFLLCALIIENVSGLTFEEYMVSRILEPLGMTGAVVDRPDLRIPLRVTGYELRGDTLCQVERYQDWMLGAGDLVGTLEDAYCLNKALKRGLLLAPETWQAALTPSPVSGMGMGCTVSTWHGKRRITHNGGASGFRTLHIWLPEEDFDIVFLSNSGFGNARADLSEIFYRHFYENTSEPGERVAMDTGYIPKI